MVEFLCKNDFRTESEFARKVQSFGERYLIRFKNFRAPTYTESKAYYLRIEPQTSQNPSNSSYSLPSTLFILPEQKISQIQQFPSALPS